MLKSNSERRNSEQLYQKVLQNGLVFAVVFVWVSAVFWFECGVVPQARANAQVKTLHKRVLNSPLLGGCFFRCVRACVRALFKQPGDSHFLLSQSI